MRRLLACSFLFCLVASALSAQTYSGTWCGTTSAGKKFYFRVDGTQIKYFSIGLKFDVIGTNDCPVGWSTAPSTASVAGNTFNFSQGNPVDLFVVKLNGTFTSGTDATGSFDVTVNPGITMCGARTTGTWTAVKSTPIALSPSTINVGSGGGRAKFDLVAGDACTCDASTNASWITVYAVGGTGSTAVTMQINPNSGTTARSSTVKVYESAVTINQGTTPDVRPYAVVGSLAGSLGSFFRTAVQLHNATNDPMTGKFVFHPQGAPGSDSDPSLSYSLAARATQHFADLLPAMSQSGIGSVDVISTRGGFPMTLARVFNDGGAAGTTGMTQDLVRSDEPLTAGSDGVLIAPPDPATARFNVGIRTLSSGAGVTVKLRDAAGLVRTTVSRTYPANYFEQIAASSLLGGITPAANDTLTFHIDSGSVVVYGAATDNTTQDPAMQVARAVNTSSTGDSGVLAVVGSAAGSLNSFFRTAVQMHNATASPISGKVVYHPQAVPGSPNDPSMTYSLAPGQTVAWADLLPQMGQSGLGSVDVISTSGPLPVTVARIYNDAGAKGTTGMSEPLLSTADALRTGDSSVLIAPPDLSKARYNIGVRSLDKGVSMTVYSRDAGGAILKQFTKTYAPNYFEQVGATTFLGADLPQGGSITISVSSGSAILYGATTDNTTQDPSVQFTSRKL